MLVKCKIKGRSPLLMYRFDESQLSGNRIVDKNATPREIAENYAYFGEKGNLIIPTVCVFSTIMAAGKFHKLGKNQITTMKSSLIPAGLSILNKECDLGTKKYEVDSRPIVNAIKGRVMCHRPRLDEWSTSFTLDIDTEMFSEKLIRLIVDDAGKKIGLLSYRPACKGWFGKFDVVEWKVTQK